MLALIIRTLRTVTTRIVYSYITAMVFEWYYNGYLKWDYNGIAMVLQSCVVLAMVLGVPTMALVEVCAKAPLEAPIELPTCGLD